MPAISFPVFESSKIGEELSFSQLVHTLNLSNEEAGNGLSLTNMKRRNENNEPWNFLMRVQIEIGWALQFNKAPMN